MAEEVSFSSHDEMEQVTPSSCASTDQFTDDDEVRSVEKEEVQPPPPQPTRGRLLFGVNQTIEFDRNSPASDVARAPATKSTKFMALRSILTNKRTTRRGSLLNTKEAKRSARMPRAPERQQSFEDDDENHKNSQRRRSLLGTTEGLRSAFMPNRPNRRTSCTAQEGGGRRRFLLGTSEVKSSSMPQLPCRRGSALEGSSDEFSVHSSTLGPRRLSFLGTSDVKSSAMPAVPCRRGSVQGDRPVRRRGSLLGSFWRRDSNEAPPKPSGVRRRSLLGGSFARDAVDLQAKPRRASLF